MSMLNEPRPTGTAPGQRLFRLPALLLLLLPLLLGACATAPPVAQLPDQGNHQEQACVDYFTALDGAVLGHGVRDGVGAPMADYPWFRSTRLLAHLADELSGAELSDALLAHDRQARAMELRNLPLDLTDRLARNLSQDLDQDIDHRIGQNLDQGLNLDLDQKAGLALVRDAGSTIDACGARLAARMLANDPELLAVRANMAVPDDYITWHRWAGLYPVSRLAILAGVGVWQRGTRADFQVQPGQAAAGPGLRYMPAGHEHLSPSARLQGLVADAARDALGRPQLDATGRDLLLAAHAPVIELERDAGHNRIGEPLWQAPGKPNVNVAMPLVYTSVTHTRFNNETLVQLNYVFWFSSRPKQHPLDILGGRLDGLTLRLTLDTAGRLLLLESMHNCGCYHQHYPLSGLRARARPDYGEPPLILDSPGAPGPGQRLVVRLRDRSHYVASLGLTGANDTVADADADADSGIDAGAETGVGTDSSGATPSGQGGGSSRYYVLTEYDDLRSLPLGDRRQSLFDHHGLVDGTRRDEQVLFWVSGVRAPGAMRQMGRHATAFAGRRHFDDPDLLDRLFVPAEEPGD